MHFLSYAALANVTRTRLCGLGLDLVHKIRCHSNVPRGIEKLTAGRSSILYGHSSTNTANTVKIVTAGVQIIGVREIAKKEIQQQNI